MSRKGENIYKRKDGRWEARYIKHYDVCGKAKYGYLYARTYTEVKAKLSETKAEIRCGRCHHSQTNVTYDKVLSAWLQSTKINVKDSTYMRYKHLIETHIAPSLGKCKLIHINSQMIESYVASKLENGRTDGAGGLSPKTVTDIITIIKSSMNYAECHGYDVSCNLRRLSVKKREKEMRVLSRAEQKDLTKVLLYRTDLTKLGILLSLYTGIRIGELCALRWENLQIETKTLQVRETMQRIQNPDSNTKSKTKIVITEPKSKCSVRDIPLPDFLLERIREHQSSPRAFVLTGKENQYIEPRTLQYRFYKYVAESGIQKTNYHALRHTFATRCVEVGFEIKSLSEILGHANVNITLNRYVHSSFDLKYNNMCKLYVVF